MNQAFPSVGIEQVDGFLKHWKNGVVLLDETSKEFARDFANVVLRSLVIEMAQARAMEQAQTQTAKSLVAE